MQTQNGRKAEHLALRDSLFPDNHPAGGAGTAASGPCLSYWKTNPLPRSENRHSQDPERKALTAPLVRPPEEPLHQQLQVVDPAVLRWMDGLSPVGY